MSEGACLAVLGVLGLAVAMPLCTPGAPGAAAVRYHAMRTWGVSVPPPPEVVDQAIDQAADRHGVPRELFRKLVRTESAKNPNAVSPKGAIGLGQVMPQNHKRCGLADAHQLRDVIFNANCSAQILKEEIATYGGDVGKALRAYNGGPKCVRGKCAESEAYVRKILG